MIVIIREWFFKDSTIGSLFINGKFFCYTLEDSARAAGVKVKFNSAIPAGVYSCRLTYSPKFKKEMPIIYNRPGDRIELNGVRFDGVRIHGGNDNTQTDGCILVGFKKTTDGRIYNSASSDIKITIQKLFKGLEFNLIIVNKLL